jgi:hypothetical protein
LRFLGSYVRKPDYRKTFGPDFHISLRNSADALKDDGDGLKRDLDHYAEIGVDQVISEPRQRDAATRLKAAEAMWRLCEPYG